MLKIGYDKHTFYAIESVFEKCDMLRKMGLHFIVVLNSYIELDILYMKPDKNCFKWWQKSEESIENI